MSLNMKSLTQALAKTAAAIEKTVQSTVQEVTGPKALQDYELLDQVGSGGPGLAWKLYLGKPRNRATQAHHPEVCVWLLDKKSLADARLRVGISKAAEGAFVDVIKADAAQMMRLRHPGIVRVVEGLDESKGVMVMVTEPIFASVANLLGDMENVQKIPKELNGLELGQLEIKHGLLQLADSLAFLHNNARIVHRAISPEAIFVTSSGAWKLGGFGHALNLDHVGVEADAGPAYHYPDYDVEDIVMPLQPQLDYTAPELTRSQSTPRTTSDIFSLACLAYHLLARKPLIKSKNNLRTYTSKVTYLMNENFLGLPSELVPDIRRMLNPDEMSRPSALDFTGSPFFRDDVRLRALRFLDHMLETDNVQKADFLKALGKMWTDFDSRILRYKVLPPLCAELRNQVMQPMVLPMVLTIAEAQDKSDFELSTFPALLPVLTTATGDSLLLLVKHAALLIKQVSPEQLIGCVIPMLVRAYDDPDARIQEEVLRRTLSFSRELDFPVLTQSILPRVHALALKTTVAAVRVNALLCLGKLVHQLDKPAVIDVLQTLKSCTAVDHSAPTLMCTLEVASSIYKQFGIEFAVDQLLPLLTPLLIAQQLNIEQFGKYMLFVKEILRKIEEKRGVPPNENEVMTSNSLSAFQGEINGRRTTVNGRGSSLPDKGIYRNWDDDYWSSARSLKAESSSNKSMADTKISDSISSSSRPAVSTSAALITSLPTSRSYNTSVASYSTPTLEWPPPSIQPANVQSLSTISGNMPSATGRKDINTPMYTVNSNIFLNPTSISDGSDPFADWPPSRHSSANNLDQSKEKTKDPYVFSGLNRPELVTSDSKSLQEDRIDVASFFSSTSPLQPQPSTFRIAPPPSTGLGKGKGRNPIRPIGSANQPSTLDLL